MAEKEATQRDIIVYGPKKRDYKTTAGLLLLLMVVAYGVVSGINTYVHSTDPRQEAGALRQAIVGSIIVLMLGIGVFGLIIGAYRRRPQLTLSPETLKYDDVTGKSAFLANWKSVGPFELTRTSSGKTQFYYIQARVIGVDTQGYTKGGFIKFPMFLLDADSWNLVAKLNLYRRDAIGVPKDTAP